MYMALDTTFTSEELTQWKLKSFSQTDGLAMCMKPVSLLSNICFSKYEPDIQGITNSFERHMENIILDI